MWTKIYTIISAVANDGNHVEKDNEDEPKPMTIEMEGEKLVELKCAETDREALFRPR